MVRNPFDLTSAVSTDESDGQTRSSTFDSEDITSEERMRRSVSLDSSDSGSRVPLDIAKDKSESPIQPHTDFPTNRDRNCTTHKEVMLSWKQYKAKGASKGVQLDRQGKKAIKDNHRYVKCLLESLLYCAQGIALRGRGHQETNQELLI